jgi:hypothetical protein
LSKSAYVDTCAVVALAVGIVLAVSGSASAGPGLGKGPAANRPAVTAKPALLHLSPDGSDTNRCTRAAPCLSFARAYQLAPAGATVTVAPGRYGSGSCERINGSKTAYVTFAGPARARVACQLLLSDVHRIAFKGITLYQVSASVDSSRIRLLNLSVTCSDAEPYTLYPPDNLCASFIQSNASHVLIRHVRVGPTYDSSACGGQDTNKFGTLAGMTDLTLDHVTFHDARFAASCSQHTENVVLAGGRNVTFRDCLFENPASSGPNTGELFITHYPSSDQNLDGLTVENCIFKRPAGSAAIDGSSDQQLHNALFRNNTWTSVVFIQDTGYVNVRFVGNLGANQSCPTSTAGVSYSHNLWYYDGTSGSADRCGPSDTTLSGPTAADRLFANFAKGDLRLRRRSPAVDRGDPRDFPRRDFFGIRRPQGKRPDAGASELLKPKPKKAAKKRSAAQGSQLR